MFGDAAVWLGGLDGFEHYQALADWASDCGLAGELRPLPPALARLRMQRFLVASPLVEIS
jgi:hypothetical protein